MYLQSEDNLRELPWCPALAGDSPIPRAWIYSMSHLFFPSDIWVLFYVTFPLLIQAVPQHFAVSADTWFWNIFSLNGRACLGSWELPGMFLLVDFKCCAENFLCFPCLWHQNGLCALCFLALLLAVAREEPLPWVCPCACALSRCIRELNVWGRHFPAFSCELHCSIPNPMARKPHKKCFCLTDRLGPGCKRQPKVSKWVIVHTHI